MKKNLILGMVLVVGAQMAMAAGAGRGIEGIRKAVTEEAARSKAAGEARLEPAHIGRVSSVLSRISGTSREVELKSALSRTITVKDANGTRTVSLMELGNFLSSADQALRTQNLSGLDAAGKAHLEATLEAIKVASEFVALASRTSEGGAVLTELQKTEIAAFNKQLSLIQDMITKMDTADLRAHVAVMKKAIAKKTNPNMNGDKAFAEALKEGKSEQDYLAKLKELVDCV